MDIAVIISTYNRSHDLYYTVQNILKQSVIYKEIIIIDDASAPDHAIRVSEISRLSSTIRVIRNQKNRGLARSLNRGISVCNSSWIARIDDHDLWIDHHKIHKQVESINDNDSIVLVGTGYQERGEAIINPLDDGAIRSQALYRCPFSHVTVLFSKRVFDIVGGYDESMNYGEDWDLWLKMMQHGQVKNLSDITTEVSANNGMSYNNVSQQYKLGLRLVKRYGIHYPHRYRATMYHRFVYLFFITFPRGGRVHRLFQILFKRVFYY